MMIAPTSQLARLRDLPATVTLPVAGTFFGLSRAGSYLLHQRGQFPCPVRQIGSRYVVTQADLAEALGVSVAALLADQ
ncbi:hypothetical protein [Plantibacter cousiniae (nom. nud.)]|uniref:DNA-binding protein n=1 Tax=Plantibacter cousiniae (nom. nud.) TaxID=199709 RepID=A0ABY1LLL0_9MICO|nr:hypothetical protein [Plantibacter cousiniae]SKC50517.1 hypothetical protein SAMN06295973_1485 [Plantibacter cousiniae]